MTLPAIQGIIRRRILLNYRITPDIAQTLLPAPFRPKLIHGHAIAGICLIRLEQIRPKGLPALLGISSENSAHRIAVEWDTPDGHPQEGVYVPRRDTDSRLNALAGGRIFPGVHHLSKFHITDHQGHIAIKVTTPQNDTPLVDLSLQETSTFPTTSIFSSLQESSAFFEAGCIGYSPRPDSCTLDGLHLQVPNWQVSPLTITHAHSSYFGNPSTFPPGTIELDHALLMRDIPHQWNSHPQITTT